MCLDKIWTMLYYIYSNPPQTFSGICEGLFCCQSNQYHIYYTTSINRINTKEKHPHGCLSFCKCPNYQAAQVTCVWVDAFFDLTNTIILRLSYVNKRIQFVYFRAIQTLVLIQFLLSPSAVNEDQSSGALPCIFDYKF